MSAWYVLAAHGVYSFLPGSGKFLKFGKGHALFPATKKLATHTYPEITPLPSVSGPQLPFRDNAELKFSGIKGEGPYEVKIFQEKPERKMQENFILRGGTEESRMIENDATIEFYSYDKPMGQAEFRKMESTIKLVNLSEYNNPYDGGGREALIDGVRGGEDFRTGSWQGWQGKIVEAEIDLGKNTLINSISASVLQDAKSWIWFPSKMEVLVSEDGKQYIRHSQTLNTKPLDTDTAMVCEMTNTINAHGRFVKIILSPAFEKIPEWHLGAGGNPWIFVDEIIIR
jgi:hypothetical protein